jgi:hypothetical protein
MAVFIKVKYKIKNQMGMEYLNQKILITRDNGK